MTVSRRPESFQEHLKYPIKSTSIFLVSIPRLLSTVPLWMINLVRMYLTSAFIKPAFKSPVSRRKKIKGHVISLPVWSLVKYKGLAEDRASPYFAGLAWNEQVNLELEKQDTYFQFPKWGTRQRADGYKSRRTWSHNHFNLVALGDITLTH